MSARPTIAGATGARLDHEAFPHLSTFEWDALHRLALSSNETVVTTLLMNTSPEEQREAAQAFMARELAEAQQRAATPARPKSSDVVKLDISKYSGEGAKRMALNRWFCEVDIACQARQLTTEYTQKYFLLSNLSGKAKEWALGKQVADPDCFPTLQALKDDLRLAFEPPHDEAQQRTAFLALKQARMSMRDYIQRAKQLVSGIVTHPIDMVTQVHVFVAGMNPGYQHFYLTRKPPATLEEAFATALREDYGVTASQAFSQTTAREQGGAVPMEIDAIEDTPSRGGGASRGRARRVQSGQRPLICYRCRKPGHRAAECRAPAPVLAVVDASDDAATLGQSKNGDDQ